MHLVDIIRQRQERGIPASKIEVVLQDGTRIDHCHIGQDDEGFWYCWLYQSENQPGEGERKAARKVDSGISVGSALDKLDDLADLIDEAISSNIASEDFCEDVRTSSDAVRTTIEETQRVTTAQMEAIENWTSGVSRWIH